MEASFLIRVLLLVLSLPIFGIIARLTRAPSFIVKRVLSICWIVGVFIAIIDIIALKFSLWHYNRPFLLLNLPLDIYISASIILGAGLGVIFWFLRKTNSYYLNLFLFSVPILGFLNDYLGGKIVKNTLPVIDSPYWFIVDMFAWIVGWIVMLGVYKYIFKL